MTNKTRPRVLVTGGAGFIGSHLVDRLLCRGDDVYVLDNFNSFYDPAIKRHNIRQHLEYDHYTLVEGDLRNPADLDKLFHLAPFDTIVHLAAMAGVRPSLEHPSVYMDVNVTGTQRLIERMVATSPGTRLVFGSSSSVYGNRSGERFLETDRTDQPLSPYAASKVAGELLSYAAHHTAGVPVVCLRFFTVFGPRQRPDLAIHKFCRLIDRGEPIEIYGDGTSKRDYTYVQDIIDGIERAMDFPFSGYEIINLGRSEPLVLKDMIACLEQSLGKKAKPLFKPVAIGDMPYTYASIDKARQLLSYEPSTSVAQGIDEFVTWYRNRQVAAPSF